MSYTDEETSSRFKRSLVQGLCAGVFILLAFALTSTTPNPLFVAAIGASSCIAFTLPHPKPAQPRYLVGGYSFGALWGTLCSLGRQEISFLPEQISVVFFCALAVFLTILCMKYFNVEHPPSAALTISITLSATPLAMSLIALLTIAGACLSKQAILWYLEKQKQASSETISA